MALLILSSLSFACISIVTASDPDPLQDFCVTDRANKLHLFLNGFTCKDPAHVTSMDFKSSVLNNVGNTSNRLGTSVHVASAFNFGGLNTQGLSFARIDYAKAGVVPPHNHPRASEVLFVAEGTLLAGFVDTNNTLFSETLHKGDLFVFPRGLVHFIYNIGEGAALSFSALSSQNPGASILQNVLFATKPGIPDEVLEKAFQISEQDVDHLKKVIGGRG